MGDFSAEFFCFKFSKLYGGLKDLEEKENLFQIHQSTILNIGNHRMSHQFHSTETLTSSFLTYYIE